MNDYCSSDMVITAIIFHVVKAGRHAGRGAGRQQAAAGRQVGMRFGRQARQGKHGKAR